MKYSDIDFYGKEGFRSFRQSSTRLKILEITERFLHHDNIRNFPKTKLTEYLSEVFERTHIGFESSNSIASYFSQCLWFMNIDTDNEIEFARSKATFSMRLLFNDYTDIQELYRRAKLDLEKLGIKYEV